MEFEKQFKCSECDAKFTTLEHFQTHSRRHEMSLNLSKSALSGVSSLSTPAPLSKGSLSAGVIGFPDETPTPTRFIRNCEEVGLFQDLQNVNPFDEDFRKAASSATPSGEAAGFEFTFSTSVVEVPGTPNVDHFQSSRNSKSKRRYSEQDTLNTPQVFPFFSSTGANTLTTNTASMSACLTPTPQGALNENLNGDLHPTTSSSEFTNNVSTTSYNHEEHVSIITYTSAISQQASHSKSDVGTAVELIELESPKTSSELKSKKGSPSGPVVALNQRGRLSSLKIRSKTNLKLNLKHVSIIKEKGSTLSEKTVNANIERSSERPQSNESPPEIPLSAELGSKKEVLERNRAAAHRSRERRKQWIYGLESRCRALEALLAQSQAEVSRLRAENESLKMHLRDNSGKKITTIEPESISIKPVTNETVVIHQTSHTEERSAIQEPLADNVDSSSGIVIVSPIVLPTVKAKRGRPRKGEERRVPIFAVPITSTSEEMRSLPKIPIRPVAPITRKS